MKKVKEMRGDIAGVIETDVAALTTVTDYAPWWVIAMISLSLGLGTMV